MTENTVLFKVEVDSQGAVQGFRVSREELERLRKQTDQQSKVSDRNAASTKRQSRETRRLARDTRSASDASRTMRRVIGTVFTVATVRQAIQYADTMTNLESRLRVVTDTTAELNFAQESLLAISNETRSSLESTTELYARLELSLQSNGTAQEDVLRVTETLNKAYKVSGATSAEAANSIIQLSQGLAAGALRGDEFRSVMEQAPRVVQALTDSLGLTRGELRELANDGKLTTEVIVAALLEQGEAIDSQFAKVEVTVESAFTVLRNNVLTYIGDANEATGATALLVDGIETLSENVDTIANVGLAAMATGLTVVTLRFGQAAIAARGFLFALGPIGIAAAIIGAATFAFLEYARAQDTAAISASDLRDRINEATDALRAQDAVMEAIAQRDLAQFDLAAAQTDQRGFLDQADDQFASRPDLAEGPLQAAISLQDKINELKETIASYNTVIAEGEERTTALAEAQSEAKQTAADLLNERRLQIEANKEYSDALKLAKDAVAEFGDEQQRADLINASFDETLASIRAGLGGVVGAENLLAAAILATNKARRAALKDNKDTVTSIQTVKDAMREMRREVVDTTEEGFLVLELALEELENQFGIDQAEVEALRKRLEELRLELGLVAEAGANAAGSIQFIDPTAGGFQSGLGSSLQQARVAGESMAGAFTQTIKDNPLGAAAFGLGSIANFQNLKDQGATGLEALNEIAKTIPIPEVQAVAQILGFVNDIFSGGLFGTKFETDQSRRSFSIDAGGASGGIEIDQSKKKSFFRGTARKTIFEDLDPDTQRGISDLFQSALDALTAAVDVLGVTAPDFVAGKFAEEFDKDGNLTKSISTFFGRTFEESFEEFSMRLIAENLIAAVGEAVGDVEVTRTVSSGVGPGGIGDITRFGGGEGLAVMQEVTEMVNEAHAIAERWRDDAELLLEGAQLLLAAQSAIQDGDGLLDTLTQTVDIVEELQDVGESLITTYERLVDSVELLETSLELLDQSFELGREEFVRFAEEFTDAAGSVDNAATLWKNYFNVFLDADELLEARLRIAQRVSSEELADIGVSPGVGRDEFRRLFEDVLPTLSADALNEWLEAASALGSVLELEEQLGIIRAGNVEDLIDAFDDIRDSVGDILGSTINDLRRELLSPAELHNELRTDALGLAGRITGAESRNEVLDLVSEINALVRDTRGAAGDTRFNTDLIEFLEQVGLSADIRLGTLQAEAIADAELVLREIEAREGFVDSTTVFSESVQSFADLLNAENGIIIGGADGSTLQESIVDGIREGFDPEAMAAMMASLAQTVQVFADITQFHASNPPTLRISQSSGSDIGLT